MSEAKLQPTEGIGCIATPKKLTGDLDKIIYLALQIDQEAEEITQAIFGPRPQSIEDNIKNSSIYGISERVDITYARLETALKTLISIRERL